MWWCCDLSLQPRVPALAKTTKSHHCLLILLVADSSDFAGSSRTIWSSNSAARSVNWSAGFLFALGSQARWGPSA
jgi:hypothetical protein